MDMKSRSQQVLCCFCTTFRPRITCHLQRHVANRTKAQPPRCMHPTLLCTYGACLDYSHPACSSYTQLMRPVWPTETPGVCHGGLLLQSPEGQQPGSSVSLSVSTFTQLALSRSMYTELFMVSEMTSRSAGKIQRTKSTPTYLLKYGERGIKGK